MTFKEARIAEGLSVAAWGRKYGISVSTVRRSEAGTWAATMNVFGKTFITLPRESQFEFLEHAYNAIKVKTPELDKLFHDATKSYQRELADKAAQANAYPSHPQVTQAHPSPV